MRGRKQKARGKREMIDEGPELGLVSCQCERPVEPEGEKHHVGCRQERRFRKIRAGEEARDESELEHHASQARARQGKPAVAMAPAVALISISLKSPHDKGQRRPASYEGRRRRPSAPVVSVVMVSLPSSNLEVLWFAGLVGLG